MKKRLTAPSASGGVGVAWAAMSSLVAGFVVWGGIGWLLDRWLGTRFLTPIGVILGMGLGIYAVVARFGRAEPEPAARPAPPVSPVAPSPADEPSAAATQREPRCP